MAPTIRAVLLVVLSAVLLTLSFPPAGLGLLAWVGLVPFLVAIKGKALPAAYLLGALAGLVFFAGFFSWMWALGDFNILDFVLLELYFTQYFAFFALVLNLVDDRAPIPLILTAPALWVALEYLRSHFIFLALPMALLGHSQHRLLPLIQITSVTGVYGVSFLVVLVNTQIGGLLGTLLDQRGRRSLVSSGLRARAKAWAPLGVTMVTVVGTFGYGLAVLAAESNGDQIAVAVVQQNVSPQRARDPGEQALVLERYLELSLEVARRGPALIVWPETAVPFALQTRPGALLAIANVARATRSHLLIGSADSPKLSASDTREREHFNSALLISPRGRLEGVYHKIRLVPFGEYIPLKGIVTWPSWLVSAGDELTPGTDHTLLRLSAAPFGVVICWETLFATLFRASVQRGAQFMVNITNEAWFATTAAPSHFLSIGVFRAVEHRIALVRVANSGFSSFIDGHGRVTRPVPDAGGAASQAIVLNSERTFYSRHGDLFAQLGVGVALLAVAGAAWRRRRA